VQKNGSKTVHFLQFLLKTRSFLQKNAKKRKFLLIFTLIFSPKTNKSYKTTIITIVNHPIFQNFPKNPLFFDFFYPFSFCLFSFSLRSFTFVLLSLASLLWLALNLPFWLFKFVSDFDIRISSAYSFTHLHIHTSTHPLIYSFPHSLRQNFSGQNCR
jgi:hypothetical protein